MHNTPRFQARRAISLLLACYIALLGSFLVAPRLFAQTPDASNPVVVTGTAQTTVETIAPTANSTSQPSTQAQPSRLRLETTQVAGGAAEILTVFGELSPNAAARESGKSATEIPLVSVLRDTLGDANPDNDRLRYVWMLTYTRPDLRQRIAAAVPFLYMRVGNKMRASKGVPPAIIDLGAADKDVWQRFLWIAVQSLLLNPQGLAVKLSTQTYRHNLSDYRKAHLIRALAVLSLYESQTDQPSALSALELHDVQARLMLAEDTFGGVIDDVHLQRVHAKQTTNQEDVRGHNWELLRQRSEAEGLYFEPLSLPDGTASHAMIWIARKDVQCAAPCQPRKSWSNRFLNVQNPWRDGKLWNWRGYTEQWYFDETNARVGKDAPNARAVEMIPLALYGLDHPKIPILLVDFRDNANAKQREMSRRVLDDVVRNVLALSKFGDLHYFLGRFVYDFVTGQRGMDINQPTRLRAYSQLKLLLALNESLDEGLRREIQTRMDRVSLNPLENGADKEAEIARQQYASLMAYAKRPDGLVKQLENDRRTELVPLRHGNTAQVMYRLANIASLGLYTKREQMTAEARGELDIARQVQYHTRFLREVANSTARIEVAWRVEDVRRSLEFMAANGARADDKAARAIAAIFAKSADDQIATLALDSLYRINNETAKRELLRVSRDEKVDARLRERSVEYLRRAVRERQRIAPADMKAVTAVVE